jgi:enediyne biosynthesis protein E4
MQKILLLLLLTLWLPGIRLNAAGLNSGVRFVDITAQAGITFKHVSSPEKRYIVESMSGGVALFDYDNDGRLDIYLVNSLTVDLLKSKGKTPSELYRNNGNGTFTNVTAKAGVGDVGWGMGVCVGDYNNDGFDDLYVTCLGPNHLFKNNGDGSFTDVTKAAGVGDSRWSTGAAFVDFDNDGFVDLMVSNYVDFDVNNLPEFGKGKPCQYRGIAVQCGPRGLKGAGDTLYRNNGDGSFTDVSVKAGVSDPNGYYGLGIGCSDFDGDGWMDIFVANDATPNFLYHNNGNGTFKDIGFVSGAAVNENGSEQACMGVTVGDYDRDGRFDIFATNFSQEYNILYRGTGANLFTDVSYTAGFTNQPFVSWGTKFFDYENDGWLDLFVANGHVYPQVDQAGLDSGYRQRKYLHKNNRNKSFSDVTAQSGDALLEKRVSRGAAFGDIDNDGDVDLIVNDLDGAPQLLRNDGGNANHSLIIKTLGTKSNRNGIGARVKVVSGDLTQIDEVRSGASYISHNDFRLHFGLERRSKVELLEVRWPSGAIEKFENPGINRILVIQEGKGIIEQKELSRAPAK